jgi:hypothetical protein
LLLLGLTLLSLLGCAGSHPGATDASQSTSAADAAGDGAERAQPAGAESADAAGTLFEVRVPPKGSVRVDESEQSMHLELVQRQGQRKRTLVQETLQRAKTRTTVLAATENAVTEKRVEYLEGTSEQRIGNRKQSVPNPLIGKTYVLRLSGAELVATGKGGQAVSEYERERLARDNPNLGKPSQFAELIPRRPVGVGERLSPDPQALAAAFGKRDVEVTQAAFTLRRVSERKGTELGHFEVSFTVAETSEKTVNRTELKGTVVLQTATCWPEEIDLEGRVSVEGKPPNEAELQGSGTVRIQVRSDYE